VTSGNDVGNDASTATGYLVIRNVPEHYAAGRYAAPIVQ